ncbi:MAG: MMPL family transporter [Pseudomonadota bacterium]
MSDERFNERDGDAFVVSLARLIISLRWLVVLLTVGAAISLSTGAQYLSFSNDYRTFFSEQNPELRAFEELQATFTKTDSVVYVVVPEDGDVFSAQTLSAIEQLTESAWQIPFAGRVDSLSNFQYTYSIDDDLIVEDFLAGAADFSPEELERRRQIALDEPLLNGQLVTANSAATAVSVVLNLPGESLTEVPEAVAKARAVRDEIRAQNPDLKIYMTGTSMLNNAFSEAIFSDFGSLIPAMIIVVIVTTMIAVRSVSATIAAFAVVIFSVAGAMGWAGFVGIQLAGPSPSATIVILTLALADSIHILITARGAIQRGMDKREAMIEAIRVNFLPVLITSITTIVGFLALNFSDAPPFRDFGNISAVGIAIAWFLSITLLPSLFVILPVKYKEIDRHAAGQPTVLNRFAGIVTGGWPVWLLVTGGFAAFLVTFIPTIELSDQWGEYFDERIEFRRDTDAAGEHIGIYPIEFIVDAKTDNGITDPNYLASLDKFSDWLRDQPNIVHVYSLTDIMKRLNKNLNGDDPTQYRLPENSDLAAQYLLLYELSLPYGLDLNDRINIDKSKTRVTAMLEVETTTKDIRAFLKRHKEWTQANLGSMESTATSSPIMFSFIAQRNVESMIEGTTIAIIAIGFIMMVALRSVTLGAMSIVANGLPILAAFGVWGLLIGEVGFSVAAIVSLSLGIVIDDTVHFLTKFRRARNEIGLSTKEAIRYAFETVGLAIIINTIVLGAGFLILTLSAFKINAELGLFTTLAIGLALVFDFLFLPALLILTVRDKKAPTH